MCAETTCVQRLHVCRDSDLIGRGEGDKMAALSCHPLFLIMSDLVGYQQFEKDDLNL